METQVALATETAPEDPLQRADAESASTKAFFPDCVQTCAIQDLLKTGRRSCAYHSLRLGAARGKTGVRDVLENIPNNVFAELLVRGADAPCITNPQTRAIIDGQINAEDHDRRSARARASHANKQPTKTEAAPHIPSEEEVLADEKERQWVPPRPRTTLEEIGVYMQHWAADMRKLFPF